MNAGILGMGRYIPEKIITNQDLEKRMTQTMSGYVLEQVLKLEE